MRCDINGDGHADVAVGVAPEGIGDADQSGAVHVFYGSDSALQPTGDDLWHQGDAGIIGGSERGDLLGSTVACADFDGDGFADLAAGAHGETIGDTRAGAVQVFYGSSDGLTSRNDLWHADDAGIKGVAAEDDQFGRSVAAGLLDDDQYADLIIGSPGADVSGENGAGAVHVLYGSADGVSARDDLWHQDVDGILAIAGARDFFGQAVGAGDFDGDGFPDLAAGVVGESLRGNDQAGAVHVLYGSNSGVTTRDQLWHQNDSGVAGVAEGDDLFGFSLFAADFDADGSDDLIVGVAGEGIGGAARAGAAQTLYGGDQLLTSRGELWHQNDRGVAGAAEGRDNVGWSLP